MFLRPSAKSCVFCWWDGVIASTDACLHTSSTVISTWSKLCEIYFRICLLSRPEVVTEPALHRRSNDNFQWCHWHRSWHCDSSRFSTHYAMSLCNVLSRDLLSSEYRKDAPWLARKGRLLWIHNMISALAFSFCVIFDVTVFSTYSGYIRPRYNESLW